MSSSNAPLSFLRLIALTVMLGAFSASTYAACTSPVGQAGQMLYASNLNSMVFCDGANWVSMSGGTNVTVGGNVNNPAGNDYELQFKSGTAFGSSSGLTWNTSTNTLTATNIAGTLTTAAQPNITSVGTLTGLTVNGTVSATTANFTTLTVNGQPITGNASGDRITSGTATAIANQSTGYISLTTGATTWGYLGSSATYLPTLNAAQVSTTNVNATNGIFNPTAVATIAGGGGNYIVSGTTQVSTSSTGSITFVTGGVQRVGIDSSGRVGIGLSTPAYQLDVNGAINSNNAIQTSSGLYSNDGTTIARIISSGGSSFWGNTSNHPMLFQTNNIERMRIDSSGNVGIGTTTPATKLEVAGAIRSSSGGVESFADSSGQPYKAYTRSSDGFAWAPLVMNSTGSTYVGGFTYSTSSGVALAVGSGLATVQTWTSNGNSTLTGTLTQNSDARLKTDIKPIPAALEKLSLVNGVTFHWKDKSRDQKEQMGVIAQDVQKAFPQLVNTDASGTLSVNYPGMVAPLIEAVKELKAENTDLRAQLQELKQQVKALQNK